MSTSSVILCACGCGQEVPRARYPSQQRHYINHHQHRGTHNGNYRGGKTTKVCAVCQETFRVWPTKQQERRTCGKDACYRTWQGLTTAARGQQKRVVPCASCGAELRLYPSQVSQYNYCNRYCQHQHHGNLVNGINNANWQGGKAKFFQAQTRIRDGHRCVICGFDLATDVHHITPRADGGSDDCSNLITLCPNHHRLADLGIISVEHLRNTTWKPDAMLQL